MTGAIVVRGQRVDTMPERDLVTRAGGLARGTGVGKDENPQENASRDGRPRI